MPGPTQHWTDSTPAEAITAGEVHVWRVALDDTTSISEHWASLSGEERDRASRFLRETDRTAFTISHGALRSIVGGYLAIPAASVPFMVGPAGKPAVGGDLADRGLEFNLSHAGDFALVAVSSGSVVGVDVERWDPNVECLDLAVHYFSERERNELHALAPDETMAGFFNAWTRKEAYLKATGDGITGGLVHFDVSLAPGAAAELREDRNVRDATARWYMEALDVAPGYAGALVAASPRGSISLFNFKLHV